MEENNKNTGGSFIWGLIVGAILIALIWGIGKNGKYEGQTAEEWFNDNDACEAQLDDYQQCVEDAVPNIVNYCSP